MGCKGSEVQILSPRPLKTPPLKLFVSTLVCTAGFIHKYCGASDTKAAARLIDRGRLHAIDRRNLDGGPDHVTVVPRHAAIRKMNAVFEAHADEVAVQCQAERHDPEHVAAGSRDAP